MTEPGFRIARITAFFEEARGSSTNDKAGSKMSLMRWVSARTVKETFNPPQDFRYPFMDEE